MANRQRHRKGAVNDEMYAVDLASVIEQGDCLYLDTDDVKDADQVTFGNTESAIKLQDAQIRFAALFAGVALGQSRATDAVPVRVARAGIFEFDCASATFENGDLVGLDDDPTTPVSLLGQRVIAVTDKVRAIGRVAKRYASNTTSVMVRIDPLMARIALLASGWLGGSELDTPIAESFILMPAGILPVNSWLEACYGIITEVMAGTTQDQGIVSIQDDAGTPQVMDTLTPTDAGADSLKDVVVGAANGPATNDAKILVAAGAEIKALVTQVTANGDAAGKMQIFAQLVPCRA